MDVLTGPSWTIYIGDVRDGLARLQPGCRFVACELNPEYAQAGHERLQQEWTRLQSIPRPSDLRQTLLFPLETDE